MQIAKQGNGRTMMLDDEGRPILVGLVRREATTAPEGTREKAMLIAEVDGGMVPLPFAIPTVGKRKPHGVALEFRLEMN